MNATTPGPHPLEVPYTWVLGPAPTGAPCSVRFDMVSVAPGSFTMGSPASEPDRWDDEDERRVTIDRAYAIGVTPVTQELWRAVTGENPSGCGVGHDAERRPVEQVSWYDAVRFCNVLSVRLGVRPAYRVGCGTAPDVAWDVGSDGFRLPTEAEWECAARAGQRTRYAGSDDIDGVGWIDWNAGGVSRSVARKRPNAWGLHDMSGNVAEWCWDERPPSRVRTLLGRAPPPAVPDRAVRGGSWSGTAVLARVACRQQGRPEWAFDTLGLRLARTLPVCGA